MKTRWNHWNYQLSNFKCSLKEFRHPLRIIVKKIGIFCKHSIIKNIVKFTISEGTNKTIEKMYGNSNSN